jgi:16S rRNA processing protein RimM
VRGEVTLVPESDAPDRFASGSRFVTDEDPPRTLVVESSYPYRDRGLVVAFEGVSNRHQAEALRGVSLTIGVEERRSLEPGEFWPDDLVGLDAVDPAGASLGTVTDVEIAGQDRLVVTTPDGRRVLVPFVADLVGDPAEGRIVIDAPPGLFDSP